MTAKQRGELVEQWLRSAAEAVEDGARAERLGNRYCEGIYFGMALASYSTAKELAGHDAIWQWPPFMDWRQWLVEAIARPAPESEVWPFP